MSDNALVTHNGEMFVRVNYYKFGSKANQSFPFRLSSTVITAQDK